METTVIGIAVIICLILLLIVILVTSHIEKKDYSEEEWQELIRRWR